MAMGSAFRFLIPFETDTCYTENDSRIGFCQTQRRAEFGKIRFLNHSRYKREKRFN